MKVSVFGIGYVGAVTAACLADSGHKVIAVDIDPWKVDCINMGQSPFTEKGLEVLISKGIKAKRLAATTDGAQAIKDSEISLICVGTPGGPDGTPLLDDIKTVCAQIGASLKEKKEFHTVVIRSTVLPGTLENVIKSEIEKASGKIAGKDFGLGNNPEFMREGSAIDDYFSPTKILAGGDERTTAAIMRLYEGIDAPRVVTEAAVAESVKYVSNAWRACKVGFANEIGNILKGHGIDSHKVMNIFFEDTKINLGKSFLIPGFAFGGSCLPKDVRALLSSANDKGLKSPLFASLLESNHLQIQRGFDMIKSSRRKKVGLLGVSFKPGTDDLRESPLVTLAEMLLSDGFSVSIYDPCVYKTLQGPGSGRLHIEKKLPHIAANMVASAEEVLARSDVLVIGKNAPDFVDIIESANPSLPVIDLVRLNAAIEERQLYQGICW